MSHKRKLHGQEHVGHGRDGHGCGGYKDKYKYKVFRRQKQKMAY